MPRLPTHLTWSAFPAVADCAYGILETHLRGTERLERGACERRRSPIPTVPTPSASCWVGPGAQRPAAMPSPGGNPHDPADPLHPARDRGRARGPKNGKSTQESNRGGARSRNGRDGG